MNIPIPQVLLMIAFSFGFPRGIRQKSEPFISSSFWSCELERKSCPTWRLNFFILRQCLWKPLYPDGSRPSMCRSHISSDGKRRSDQVSTYDLLLFSTSFQSSRAKIYYIKYWFFSSVRSTLVSNLPLRFSDPSIYSQWDFSPLHWRSRSPCRVF